MAIVVETLVLIFNVDKTHVETIAVHAPRDSFVPNRGSVNVFPIALEKNAVRMDAVALARQDAL